MKLADGVLSEDGSWAICTAITLLGQPENTCMQAPAAVCQGRHRQTLILTACLQLTASVKMVAWMKPCAVPVAGGIT